MKKLSLLLFAFCLSLGAWAGLNPYAYGLETNFSNDGTKLLLTYSLNANTETTNSAAGNPNGVGVQVYIRNKSTQQIVYTFADGYGITKGRWTREVNVSELPKNIELTWEVVAWGKTAQTSPTIGIGDITSVATKYPRAAHGVAVVNNPQDPNFGKVFVAEACTVTTGASSLLEYNPHLEYVRYHTKSIHDGSASHFSGTTNYEPHRVCVSEDGRIFVTCYHPEAGGAVLEYLGNNEFKTIIQFNKTTNVIKDNTDADRKNDGKWYSRRIVDMDVKGSGDDLKILVCWITPKGSQPNTQWHAKIECIEYEVGKTKSQIPQEVNGTTVRLLATYNDHHTNDGAMGLLYQAYRGYVPSGETTLIQWDAAIHGFISARYAEGGTDRVWLKMDFGSWYTHPGRIVLFENGTIKKENPMKQHTTTTWHYYGGNAFVVQGNTLITGDEENRLLKYTIDYSTGTLTNETEFSLNSGRKTGRWITGLAVDYANNLYVLSEDKDNMMVLSLPYPSGDVGKRVTVAPKSQEFTIPAPVPNILATDLRYEAVDGTNQYEFSFNVNTKPQVAQIRFYANEADMLAGNENYACYYQFSEVDCKQGRMSVVLDAVGGQLNGNQTFLSDKKLPRGEYFWNVYVETCESKVFAPVYTQVNEGNEVHQRLHATIDNNPENDGFGHIYAANYNGDDNCKLMVYAIGDNEVVDEGSNVNYSNRYSMLQNLTIALKNPRRPAVAPDGSVFLSDHGSSQTVTTNGAKGFNHGGIWIFDPKNETNKKATGDASLQEFLSANETTSGISFYGSGVSTKLYKTNTYDEFTNHGQVQGDANNYQSEKWMTNGYRIYTIGNSDGTIKYQMNVDDGAIVPFKVTDANGKIVGGDASGNMAIKAVSDGVWVCQHRKGAVTASYKPDNRENVALMFYNHNGERTFQSYTANLTDGSSLSQTTTSILQSTPGAGFTVSADEKYLYVVNHEGNIVEFLIGGTSAAKTLTHTRTFETTYGAISSLNFDYAGNLVATTFANYPSYESQIVIYTLPYLEKENARAIPAPKSCRRLPERIAYLGMDNLELQNIIRSHAGHGGCFIDFYRPLQAGMFNTICLPFDLDLEDLPETNPLFNAIGKEFSNVTLMDMNGEKVLCLEFTDVTNLQAYKPYLIEPSENITDVIRFDDPIELTSSDGNIPPEGAINIDGHVNTITFDDNSIGFKGVVPITPLQATYSTDGTNTPLTLLLVADNRLAALTSNTNMLGFRAYFQLAKPLPPGTAAKIVGKKPVTTNTTIVVDGKKVNVEKFLRDGRVYIRVGETLYNITGEKVIR